MRLLGRVVALITAAGCGASSDMQSQQGTVASVASRDTLGAAPSGVRRIAVQARPELVENSGATASATQAGIVFTINDSGNEPLLFAFDTTGADRGVWRVTRARNTDWEATSVGTCGGAAAGVPNACIYLGDVGDNDARRPNRTIYRVPEPRAETAGFTGSLAAEALVYRYADGPHDVEAMYVAPNGNVLLITKRLIKAHDGRRRPALVFEIPASAWGSTTAPVVAALVDSLPIVPGSAPRRQITDAALSPDGRRLAVRTYAQVFVFRTDSATGRVDGATPPSVCNLAPLGRSQGEGIAWLGLGDLVLTSEGRQSPMVALTCPMPAARTTP
jgi:hypothetical protein